MDLRTVVWELLVVHRAEAAEKLLGPLRSIAQEHLLPCCAGFNLADQGSHSHPRGDFAPYRALFSVSCGDPHLITEGLNLGKAMIKQ